MGLTTAIIFPGDCHLITGKSNASASGRIEMMKATGQWFFGNSDLFRELPLGRRLQRQW
ncbi:MAG: hypothetical protein RPU64_02980 [Candidatus Sedimenticola sp. (ex Thyasira tokunagai)]